MPPDPKPDFSPPGPADPGTKMTDYSMQQAGQTQTQHQKQQEQYQRPPQQQHLQQQQQQQQQQIKQEIKEEEIKQEVVEVKDELIEVKQEPLDPVQTSLAARLERARKERDEAEQVLARVKAQKRAQQAVVIQSHSVVHLSRNTQDLYQAPQQVIKQKQVAVVTAAAAANEMSLTFSFYLTAPDARDPQTIKRTPSVDDGDAASNPVAKSAQRSSTPSPQQRQGTATAAAVASTTFSNTYSSL